MNATEPSDRTMDDAREAQRVADEERAERPAEQWRAQATSIEEGMADAVERAAAMGDLVEPSTLPPERRPEETQEVTPVQDGPVLVDPDAERKGSPRDDA